MAPTPIDPDRIGPQIDLGDVSIPADVGQQLQTLYGTDRRPATAADWVARTRDAIELTRNRTPTVEDLCTTEDGAHAFAAASGAFRQEYVCVLDPIAYPYVTDTPGTITTMTAVREAPTTIAIDGDGVETDRADALVSIGVADHVGSVERVTPEVVYRQVCGYVRTFADEREYEQWTDTVEAATTTVSLATGIAIAGAISTTLFDGV